MNKYCKKARIIIAVLIAVITFIAFAEEAFLTQITCSILFSVLTLIIATMTKSISRQIIITGDKIKNKILRILYYVFLLPLLLVLFYLMIALGYFIIGGLEMGWLSAVIALLLCAIIYTVSFVPYLQSLVILALRFNDRMKEKDENDQE